jgi:methionine sulfoxide reductase heme-binding subunit
MSASRALPFILALTASALAVALALTIDGDAATQANMAARWTARAAFPFFLIAFSAGSVSRLWPGALTAALVRRRRQWGLAFAAAFTVHLVALGINLLVFGAYRPLLVIIGGAVAYGFIYLMALTSNTASMRMLGRHWQTLHFIGIHYTWVVFTQSYARSLFLDDPDKVRTAALFVPLLMGAMGMRIFLYVRSNRKARFV